MSRTVAKWVVSITGKEELSNLDADRIIDACWLIDEKFKKETKELLRAEIGNLADKITVSTSKV